MNFRAQDLSAQAAYQLLVGAITPRPIAWITSLSATGVLNLAPYSFFTVASCYPPVLSVTQVNPRNRLEKDTLHNLRTTGECVVNIVSRELAEQMNASCAEYPADVSEVDALAIVTAPSLQVKPAGIAAAGVRYECTLRELKTIGEGPMAGTMMFLDVVAIYVNDAVVVDEKISADLLNTIGKMGGDEYTTTATRFSLARPVL